MINNTSTDPELNASRRGAVSYRTASALAPVTWTAARVGLWASPAYGLLLGLSTLTHQPSIDDFDAYARYITTDIFLVSHLVASILGAGLAILGVFAVTAFLAHGRAATTAVVGLALTTITQVYMAAAFGSATFVQPGIGRAHLNGIPNMPALNADTAYGPTFVLTALTATFFLIVSAVIVGAAIARTSPGLRWYGIGYAAFTALFALSGFLFQPIQAASGFAFALVTAALAVKLPRLAQEGDAMKPEAAAVTVPTRNGSRLARWVRRHELGVFFGLALGLSWVAWPLVLLNPDSSPLVPFGPLIAAVTVTALAGGTHGLRRLLSQLGPAAPSLGWFLVALVGPLAFTIAAAGLATAFGASPLGHAADLTQVAATFVITLVLVGLFEELGWRGFALPRLQRRLGGLPAAAVLGAIWAFWHLPELVSDPTQQRPPLPFLTVVLAQAVIFAWLYNSTNAGLPIAILAHAATNTAAQFVLPQFTGDDYGLVWWCFAAVWVAAAVLAASLTRGDLNAHTGRHLASDLDRHPAATEAAEHR